MIVLCETTTYLYRGEDESVDGWYYYSDSNNMNETKPHEQPVLD